jgi:glycosyltransferase 2 family protein
MDNRSLRFYLIIAVSLVLSIVLFDFFIKNVDINALWASVKNSNPFFIGLGGGLLLLSHYLRAIRWTILLTPIQSDIKVKSSFIAFLIGTLSNFIVPHLGEVMRCSALKKMENTGIEYSIGTVIAERVLDVIFLSFLIVLGLILNRNALDLTTINALSVDKGFVFKVILVVAPIAILGLLFKNKIANCIGASLNQKIKAFKQGLTTIRKVEHLSLFIFLSLSIWILYYFSTYCLLKAIVPSQYIGFKVVLTVLIMSSIGWAGPTQGGIGTFHILVSKALVINGFDVEASPVIALFLHTVFSSYDILYGLLATVYLFLPLRHFKKYPSVQMPF